MAQRTLMIIDDNPHDISLLKEMIQIIDEDRNYHVVVANSAEEALRLYGEYCIDFAFIDYHLPQTNGYQLFQTLQKLPKYDNTRDTLPLIVMSSENNAKLQLMIEQSTDACFVNKSRLYHLEAIKHVLYAFEKNDAALLRKAL